MPNRRAELQQFSDTLTVMGTTDDDKTDPPHDMRGTASVSVKALLASKGLSQSIIQRIKEADKDESGGLSVEEIVKVIRSEHDAVKERQTLRKWVRLRTPFRCRHCHVLDHIQVRVA